MEMFKNISTTLIGMAMGLVVVVCAISWWRMDESSRHAIVSSAGKILAWLGVVLFLPWPTFFISGWVARKDNNVAGAVLVLTYSVVEIVALLWLFHWSIAGATAWTFLAAAGLFAAVYNLLTCDWIAEKTT